MLSKLVLQSQSWPQRWSTCMWNNVNNTTKATLILLCPDIIRYYLQRPVCVFQTAPVSSVQSRRISESWQLQNPAYTTHVHVSYRLIVMLSCVYFSYRVQVQKCATLWQCLALVIVWKNVIWLGRIYGPEFIDMVWGLAFSWHCSKFIWSPAELFHWFFHDETSSLVLLLLLTCCSDCRVVYYCCFMVVNHCIW